jgi:hypothetical protein
MLSLLRVSFLQRRAGYSPRGMHAGSQGKEQQNKNPHSVEVSIRKRGIPGQEKMNSKPKKFLT